MDTVSIERDKLRHLRGLVSSMEPEGEVDHEYWCAAVGMLNAMIAKAAEPEAQPLTPSYHLSCTKCGENWWSFEAFPTECPFCRVSRLASTSTPLYKREPDGDLVWRESIATPPPDYSPASVSFPSYAADIEALRGELCALSDQIGMHCREPHVTREELDKAVLQMRKAHEWVSHPLNLQAQELVLHKDLPRLIKTAVAEAMKAHVEARGGRPSIKR
jgi:hypothetical protein